MAERNTTLAHLGVPINRHGARKVILTVHSDCGAYGGLTDGFGGCCEKESSRLMADLMYARRCTASHFRLPVEAYLVGFNAVQLLEPEA
jgi:carbonic anhydrase